MNIVLAADNGFAAHVETLLKSLCCRHRGLRIFLLHRFGHTPEWFDMINRRLRRFDCELLSVQVNTAQFERLQRTKHLSSAAYYRFMMPLLPESRVLYLDSDMVVTAALHDLYQTDLQGEPLAAAHDFGMKILGGDMPNPCGLDYADYFNSGVLLADLDRWRSENIQQQLFDTADQAADKVLFGDQCILNLVFRRRWLPLHRDYNYQATANGLISFQNRMPPPASNPPPVVHFASAVKPWGIGSPDSYADTPLCYRKLYWQYRALDWADVASVADGVLALPNQAA